MNLQVLAEKLGLSRATISRALRNDERISLKTRERVLLAAEEAGYRQNPYVSVLMSKLRQGASPLASPVIAFINPQPSRDAWRGSKHWLFTFRGAVARAEELGFELQEFWLGEPGMTPQRLTDILRARNIRAVILAPPLPDQSINFIPENCAAVACDLEPAGARLHRVSTDYIGNTLKALRALRELGYRRIGVALETERARSMHLFPRMALLEFEESLPAADRTGWWIGSSEGLGSFAQWLQSARPDALVTAGWIPQVWLQSLGFRIPEDVGVAQLDPLFFPYQYSGIDGQYELVGRTAVDLLIARIHASEFSLSAHPSHVLHLGDWRPGFSTRSRRERAGNPGYDESRLRILGAVASGDVPRFFAERKSAMDRIWNRPFALASAAREESWRSISLLGVANARWECPSLPPTRPAPTDLPALQGVHRLCGVPFDFPPSNDRSKNTAILLTGNPALPTAGQVCRLPLDLRVQAIYFSHLAFFNWDGRAAGEYRLYFENNRVEKISLIPFLLSPPETLAATFQDSWPAHPQFASKIARPFFLAEEGKVDLDRFGYVLEFENQNVEQRLVAVEFVPPTQGDTAFLVAGLTVLLAPSEPVR